MFVTANGYAYCRADYQLNWQMLRIMPKVIVWAVRFMPQFFRDAVPAWRDEGLPEYLKLIDEWKQLDVTTASGSHIGPRPLRGSPDSGLRPTRAPMRVELRRLLSGLAES